MGIQYGRMLTAALVLALLVPALQPLAPAQLPGYWDTTDSLKAKGRDANLVGYDGKLCSIYQLRTELKDIGIDRPGRRGDIYFSAFNGTNWTAPLNLTQYNNDTGGHAAHAPWGTVYKGKLYIVFECVQPSLKDDGSSEEDYDLAIRVLDGANWTPPVDRPAHIISQPNDGEVSDAECRSIVFRDTLYFVWSQIPYPVGSPGYTGFGYRQIVYRTFDGANWGPINVIAMDNRSLYGASSLAVFKDALYVAFHSNSSEDKDTDILVSRFDGQVWTGPQRMNLALSGYLKARQNLNPRIAAYGDRIWCVWQSADGFAKSGTDYDILISSSDGSSGWSAPAELNPQGDSDLAALSGQDITPVIAAHGDRLYVAWASNSSRISDDAEDGEDYDMVMRSFDGRNWSQISLVSPYGDNATIGGDHNIGDDNQPFLYSWDGRLFCTWISYDQGGVGHKGGNPSVIVKKALGPDYGGGTDGPPVPIDETAPAEKGSALPLSVVAIAAVAIVVGVIAAVAILAFPRRPSGGEGGPDKKDADSADSGENAKASQKDKG